MAEFTVEMLAQAIRELAEEVEGAKAMARIEGDVKAARRRETEA
jgi:hypothetical protein